MRLTKTPEGLVLLGDLETFPFSILLGVLFQASETGILDVVSESSYRLVLSEGSIVGLENNCFNMQDVPPDELIPAMVKHCIGLFSMNTGTFRFVSDMHPSPISLDPQQLPSLFLIRYALAHLSDQERVALLCSKIFEHEPLAHLVSLDALSLLGKNSHQILQPYFTPRKIELSTLNPALCQLLLALWCTGQIDIDPMGAPTEFARDCVRSLLDHSVDLFPDDTQNPFDEHANMVIHAENHLNHDHSREFDPNAVGEELCLPTFSSEELKEYHSEQSIFFLLRHMDKWEASDLFVCEKKSPSIRVHGHIVHLSLPDMTSHQIETFLEDTLTPPSKEHYREQHELDVGLSVGSGMRFRLNIHKQMGFTSIVFRAIQKKKLTFADLCLPKHLQDLADLTRGLLIVTGATGSGKSTTLAAILNHINTTRHAHIVTIEEPIEFLHKDKKSLITQREVGTDTESFHCALRHVLRESPDVIMIGEMRDMETMKVALSAALTGHLVIATLHTINATQTLQRIMSYFPPHMHRQVCLELSLSLQGVLSQRLVPAKKGGARKLAVELVTCTPAISQLLREKRIEELEDLMRNSTDPGLISFNRSLLELYRKGEIAYEVGQAFSSQPEEFSLSAKGIETGIATFRSQEQGDLNHDLDMKFLLYAMREKGASDLHITSSRPPILRVNGSLSSLSLDPLTDGDMRILLNSILSGRQRSLYQLEKEVDFALSLEDGHRFRVNAYHQKGKMAASFRAIPTDIPHPDGLDIPQQVMKMVDHPHGLVLVAGPTGSGKTTTLACMIDRINQMKACRILTIEDPIEFTHKSARSTVDQREIHSDTKDFSRALKYVLRQDPDVILIGEMRDLETISAAMTAAETGHLVLATLHTNSAVQTIDRIIDTFPPHQQTQVRSQLSSCLLGVVSQRLLPRLDEVGRVAAFEIMVATTAIRHLIRDNKMHQAQTVLETSKQSGMRTMDHSIVDLFVRKKIVFEDALRFISNPQLLEQASQKMLKGKRIN